MSGIKKYSLILSTLALSLSFIPNSHANEHAKNLEGGMIGGGGFQYPNSRDFLRFVTRRLGDDVRKMDPGSFANFPANLQRDQLEAIVRKVGSRPELQNERTNDEYESEGLMIDYSKEYCRGSAESSCREPGILALQPFFDAYRALPIRQIMKSDLNTWDPTFRMQWADVRQRLLHEIAHLLDIGTEVGSDRLAEKFADRFEKAMSNQFISCQSTEWSERPTSTGNASNSKPGTISNWDYFVIQPLSAEMFSVSSEHRTDIGKYDGKSNEFGPPVPRSQRPEAKYQQLVDQLIAEGFCDGSFCMNSNVWRKMGMNFAGSSRPDEYSLENNQLVWRRDSAYLDDNNPATYLHVTVDLATGRGEARRIYSYDKTQTEVVAKLACQKVVPPIEISDLQNK